MHLVRAKAITVIRHVQSLSTAFPTTISLSQHEIKTQSFHLSFKTVKILIIISTAASVVWPSSFSWCICKLVLTHWCLPDRNGKMINVLLVFFMWIVVYVKTSPDSTISAHGVIFNKNVSAGGDLTLWSFVVLLYCILILGLHSCVLIVF